jgi:predicted dehydrogenase
MSLRIAIVGTGSVAVTHLEQLLPIRGCQVVACCDVVTKKARHFASQHKINAIYSEVHDLLEFENPDALIVAVPPHAQFQVCEAALLHGVHVLCERPLTNSAREAGRLARLAQEKNLVNMVSFESRNLPVVNKAAAIVKSGRLGRIMHVEGSYLESWLSTASQGDWKTCESLLWRMTQKHGGHGVLDDIGLTLLDCLSYVVGDIVSLNAQTRSFRKDVPGNRLGDTALDASDSAVMSAEFRGGAIGAFNLTRWATGEINSLRVRIYGDKGGMTLDVEDSGSVLKICSGADRHKGLWTEVECVEVPTIWRVFINAIRKEDVEVSPSFEEARSLHKLLIRPKKENI